MDLKKITAITVIIISLSAVTGLVFKLDGRWAKAGTVKLLSMRLDIKILEDRLSALQERIWKLEDRYPGIHREFIHGTPSPTPVSVKEEYRDLKKKISELKKQIDKLLTQQKG